MFLWGDFGRTLALVVSAVVLVTVQADVANYDSLRSREAPKQYAVVGKIAPYEITEERLSDIRKEFLYWFFDKGGDSGYGDYQRGIQESTPQIHKNFTFEIPFFGVKYNYTRLSLHGYLEFSDPPPHYTHPIRFPIEGWPDVNDPSLIGIFLSKCRKGYLKPSDIDQRMPGVYYRLESDLQDRTDQFGVEVRERVKQDIREGVAGSETYEPRHVIIATWKNVSFAGGIDSSLYHTNTFQLVWTTDEVNTYVIFNYAHMNWTSHTEAGGDTATGEGGCPAFVGFNKGNGTQSYEYKPYSQSPKIRELLQNGCGNGFPGRHIFKIDREIVPGTCKKDTNMGVM